MSTTPQIAPDQLRHALGHFATGVTVITTTDRGGSPVGTTASAVSALSLDPPLVLVCLDRASQTLTELSASGRFAVNVLTDSQRHLSDNFARRGDGAHWADVVHRAGDGPPRLDGALAVLDCSLAERVDGGDHEIVVGRVQELEVGAGELRPLVHFRGDYAALAHPETPAPRAEPPKPVRTVDCVLPTRDGAFRALALDDGRDLDHGAIVALVHGDPATAAAPLVHVHPACLLGDTFGSLLCTCGADLTTATEAILRAGAGIIVYIKPGVGDPDRRYHCGRQVALDHEAIGALLRACDVDPRRIVDPV